MYSNVPLVEKKSSYFYQHSEKVIFFLKGKKLSLIHKVNRDGKEKVMVSLNHVGHHCIVLPSRTIWWRGLIIFSSLWFVKTAGELSSMKRKSIVLSLFFLLNSTK